MEPNPLLPHLIVAQHLRTHGFHSTLQAFQSDAANAGIALPPLKFVGSSHADQSEADALIQPQYELPNLLAAFQAHQEQLRLQAEARAQANAQRVAQQSALSHLLSLSLPGPRTLPFHLKATHRTLHAANILSILAVRWPSRRFSTVSARFETVERAAIATTAADRRVVISDPESGEMLECLESSSSSSPGAAGAGHQAAVLSTAQNPKLARELVSTSMDSTVLVWDLLAGGGRPVQVIKDHSRFVVKAAYSQDGRFLATAGYDRKIMVYQREPLHAASSSSVLPAGAAGEEDQRGDDNEDDDDPEPEPLNNPFKLAYTVDTLGGNPEALVFVQTSALPLPNQGNPGSTSRTDSDQDVAIGADEEPGIGQERTWLAFSCRGECHINYLAIPRLERYNQEQELHSRLNILNLAEADVAPADQTTSNLHIIRDVEDWTLVKCNTNENADDWHVSYSLLSLALHPSGAYLSAQTGDHARPSSTTTTGAGAAALLPAPRILLLEPLRPGRVHTLFLPPHPNASAADASGSTSLSPAPRHAWILPGGEGLWVSGDDGRVRLIDVHLSQPGANATLRAEVWTQGRTDDVDQEWIPPQDASLGTGDIRIQNAEQRESAMWGRGGNTVIKDLCVLDEHGSLATCGFDRTVRIVVSKLQVAGT